MKRPEIAAMIAGAIERADAYDLHAWVVMANHVHHLITPKIDPSKITHSLKRFTAREASRILGVQGAFWQDESYDRLVRDAEEFKRIARYIEWNPVRAGIVKTPEEYPWSSAGRRQKGGAGFEPAADF